MLKLGQGSYGTVYKAVHNATGLNRAIKTIHKPSIKQKDRLENELRVMELLDHPHVIRVFETFEDDEYVYIVMEICTGGDIFDKVLDLGNFQQDDALIIFIEIMRSIHYYQSLNIVHRDLKPENFLFQNKDSFESLYIIDFGLAKTFQQGVQNQWTKAGTAYYVAPEVLSGLYDNRCDIWSAGVILYVLLCGYPPFYGETEQEILYQIKKGNFEFDGVEWGGVEEHVKALIRTMVTKAETRASTVEILDHPWLKNYNQDGQILLTPEKIQIWESHSDIKKLALLYLSTQIDQIQIFEIKQSFLFMNKSQTGILSEQEILTQTGIQYRSLQYYEFIAICLDNQFYKSEQYIILMFYFLSENGRITSQSLQKVGLTLDINIDFQAFIQALN